MQTKSEFSVTSILAFLWRWKMVLIIVAVAAAIVAAVFSSPWFITPKYKSQAVVIPPNTNTVSQAVMGKFDVFLEWGHDVMEFGEEENVDYMLQLLGSQQLKDRLVKKFDLAKHYGYNLETLANREGFGHELEENISFSRTPLNGVRITVLDKDPKMAADLANGILVEYDQLKAEMQHQRAKRALEIVENAYNECLQEIALKQDSLKKLNKMGIINYNAQSEVLGAQYEMAASKGGAPTAGALKKEVDNFAEYGEQARQLSTDLQHLYNNLNDIRLRYNNLKIDAEQSLQNYFLVEQACPAEKKSYPVRWLIVLLSMAGALAVCVLTLIALQYLKHESTEADPAQAE